MGTGICKKCGKKLVEGAEFCVFCGTKAAMVCPKCGAEQPDIEGVKFCLKCGANLDIYEESEDDDFNFEDYIEEEEEFEEEILDEEEMEQLSEIKGKAEEKTIKGAPVWDKTATGVCDCAVGECDCDGSIWN